tara:strand:- start:2714 stop:3019 length:306 start_codon:yes stop_codon:yes gene_type:complete
MTDSAPATSAPATSTPANTEPTMQQKLVDVKLDSQNAALNVIIGFITLGQQRGVYSIQESAKIWECIRMFQQPQTTTNQVEQVVEQQVEQQSENVNMDVTD